MTRLRSLQLAATVALAVLVGAAHAQAAPDAATQAELMQPAERQARPESEMLLAAANAGHRLVVAGAHGLVMLSDDGRQYRQASVPVRLQLTGLYFVDDRTGWAVGHAGVILRTDDAGEHWAVQRTGFEADQPLFSVYFRNRDEGWAVGLWSLMLHTRDGGKTWERVTLPVAPGMHKADLNLFRIFGNDKSDTLYVACEHGFVLMSADGGHEWQYVATGYQGSLWSGVAWPDGSVLVGGLRGSLYRSDDGGKDWAPVRLGQTSSITTLMRADGAVYGAGFDGLMLLSLDEGRTFTVTRRVDRLPLTALAKTPAGPLAAYSTFGVPPASVVEPVAAH